MKGLVYVADKMDEQHERVATCEIEWRGRWARHAGPLSRGVDGVNDVIIAGPDLAVLISGTLQRDVEEVILRMTAIGSPVGAIGPVSADIILHLSLQRGCLESDAGRPELLAVRIVKAALGPAYGSDTVRPGTDLRQGHIAKDRSDLRWPRGHAG